MLVSYVSQPRNSNLKLKFPILHRISKPFFWWPDPSLCPQRLSVRLSPGGFSCNVLQSQMWVQPATGHRPALIYGRECPLPRATLQSFSSLDFTALRSEISYTICTFFLHEEKKSQRHGNLQLPHLNYYWMSPCSSNFCSLLCILGTAAGLVSTLSLLPVAWATVGLRVPHNYPQTPHIPHN